jgi:hypothetical protein
MCKKIKQGEPQPSRAVVAAGAWREMMNRRRVAQWCALVFLICAAGGCQQVGRRLGLNVQPRALRDVPAARLAFRWSRTSARMCCPKA